VVRRVAADGLGPVFPPFMYAEETGSVTVYERRGSGWALRRVVKAGTVADVAKEVDRAEQLSPSREPELEQWDVDDHASRNGEKQ
jgi:hypothetical protein